MTAVDATTATAEILTVVCESEDEVTVSGFYETFGDEHGVLLRVLNGTSGEETSIAMSAPEARTLAGALLMAADWWRLQESVDVRLRPE